MGLDSTNNMTLWKDRVALELNVAILHSFAKQGVAIVDQHSCSEQFMIHMNKEFKTRGGCPSDWVWLNPSQSGSLCPIYHQEMLHYHLTPAYKRQVSLELKMGWDRRFTLSTVTISNHTFYFNPRISCGNGIVFQKINVPERSRQKQYLSLFGF